MQDSIFRLYDIRGKVGEELAIDKVYNLTLSIVAFLKEKSADLRTIAVGMDKRHHSPFIKEEMVKALLDAGINVIDIGYCTTPLLYFSQHLLPVQAGLMITASHNPPEYNGIKIVLEKQNIYGDDIKVIASYFKSLKQSPITSLKGVKTTFEIIPFYVAYLKQFFPHLVGITKNIVFDCGDGAAAVIMPELVKQFEWNNVHVACIDNQEIIHEANPADEKTMDHCKKVVKTVNAEIGIAFDGDGDRMGCVTEDGVWVSGDKLLGLFAHAIIQNNPGAAVVYDSTCSGLVQDIIKASGGRSFRTRSGVAFIKNTMKAHKALFGGELSSHFFFNDRYFGFDDGIYAALRLIELLVATQKSIKQLLEVVPYKVGSGQIRLDCKEGQGIQIVEYAYDFFKKRYANIPDIILDTLDGVRLEKADGWGLIRSSNTQPVVCIRVEANSTSGIEHIRDELIAALEPFFAADELRKHITW